MLQQSKTDPDVFALTNAARTFRNNTEIFELNLSGQRVKIKRDEFKGEFMCCANDIMKQVKTNNKHQVLSSEQSKFIDLLKFERDLRALRRVLPMLGYDFLPDLHLKTASLAAQKGESSLPVIESLLDSNLFDDDKKAQTSFAEYILKLAEQHGPHTCEWIKTRKKTVCKKPADYKFTIDNKVQWFCLTHARKHDTGMGSVN